VADRPYISYRDVQVAYPGHVRGIERVSLDIQRGEFVFLVGPTGAGKSTLLKLLTREAAHDEGEVRLDGEELSHYREWTVHRLRQRMGIVPQDFALLPRKRVWENIAYAMRAVGKTRAEVRDKVPQILEQVNIGHRADAFPNELSGGEQQRVAIGRALINDPPLILADEPTGNLDPKHSVEIMELLIRLNQRGATVVVASHDMLVIERLGQRVVRLEEGRIVSDEPAAREEPTPIVDPVVAEMARAIEAEVEAEDA